MCARRTIRCPSTPSGSSETCARTPADPVTSFDDRLARAVTDLMDTVRHEDGAGLAPQIGLSMRVFVWLWRP